MVKTMLARFGGLFEPIVSDEYFRPRYVFVDERFIKTPEYDKN
jgi:hypothetical protein